MSGTVIDLRVSADYANLKWTMQEVVERTQRSIEDVIVTGARIVCNAFGPGEQGQGATWPKSYEQGSGAVSRDIRRVYATPGAIYQMIADDSPGMAKAWWKAYKKNDLVEARRIMSKTSAGRLPVTSWDGGAAHRALRDKRGRIKKGQKPVIAIDDTKSLERYVKYEQERVGMTQRGFYVCLQQLKGRNFVSFSDNAKDKDSEGYKPWPKWITRTKGKPVTNNGEVTQQGSDWNKSITVRNTTPWASEVMSEGAVSFIRNFARERMKQYLIETLKRTKGLKKYA